MRHQRRKDLVRILRAGQAHSQEEIAEALRAAGHDVTQATVSRDLRDVGAVKVPGASGAIYRLPDEVARSATGDLMARSLVRTLSDFAIDILPAASLVVVRTAPGHAAAVARAIDLSDQHSVLGTVAGDDTIFVATPSESKAQALAAQWVAASFEPGEVAS